MVIGPRGTECDTLATVFLGRPYVRVGTASVFAYQPFDAGDLVRPIPDGSGVYVVARRAEPQGGLTTFTVERFSDGARQAARRTFTVPVAVVTQRMKDSVRAEALRRIGEMPISLQMAREAIDRDLRLPAAQPPVSGLVVGYGGEVWIRREPVSARPTFDLLSADLELVGRVMLRPDEVLIAASGSAFWTVEETPLGEYRVRRYVLSK